MNGPYGWKNAESQYSDHDALEWAEFCRIGREVKETMTEKWQIEWVSLSKIKLDKGNRNKHPQEQIDRLAKLMKHYGWVGNPIVVSTTSGICKAGEGRYLAAKQAGMNEVPVHFKTFPNEADEYGFGIEDNAIPGWAELDLKGIGEDILQFGPDFDMSLLGLQDFQLDVPLFEPGTEDDQGQLDQKAPIECPNCGHTFVKN
jgi:ParB family chromosome partitioning protein